MYDLLSDTICRIKQAHLKNHPEVICTRTKLICSVLDVLWKEGLIGGYSYHPDDYKLVTVHLTYFENLSPKLLFLKRYSKPGKRVYVSTKELKSLLNRGVSNYGFYILSTNKGILTSSKALELKIGGELICFAG